MLEGSSIQQNRESDWWSHQEKGVVVAAMVVVQD